MKLSRCGICSRSEGTSVEPSRAGSRMKCVLSKIMVTTWLTFPRGELSWQLPAALGASTRAAANFVAPPAVGKGTGPAGAAHADVTGDKLRSTAVPTATALRCQLGAAAPESPLVSFAKVGRNFI